MKLSFLLITLIFSTALFSQQGSSFEVITIQKFSAPVSAFKLNADSLRARINAVPDSAIFIPTLVYTVDNADIIDSLEFRIINSNNTEVFHTRNSVSNLMAAGVLRRTAKTFYMNPGSFSFLKRFTATARSTDKSGTSSPLKEFKKN